jgi:hypothetical protein
LLLEPLTFLYDGSHLTTALHPCQSFSATELGYSPSEGSALLYVLPCFRQKPLLQLTASYTT